MRAALETARQRRRVSTWAVGERPTVTPEASRFVPLLLSSGLLRALIRLRRGHDAPLAGTSFLDRPITLYDRPAG